MSDTYFEASGRLVSNTKLFISEKDERGRTLRRYIGYYNPRNFTVKLYSEGGSKVISAMLVKTKIKDGGR